MGLPEDFKIWHYAANKDDHSNKTCPQADMTCYFLPYHNCGSLDDIERNEDRIEFVQNEELPDEGEIYTEPGRAANEFLTRWVLGLYSQTPVTFQLTSICFTFYIVNRKQLWLR